VKSYYRYQSKLGEEKSYNGKCVKPKLTQLSDCVDENTYNVYYGKDRDRSFLNGRTHGKKASESDYQALIAAAKKCKTTDATITKEKLSLIREEINYGLWKSFADKIKAPLFTAADLMKSRNAMDAFGKVIGMGKLGCIAKYYGTDKCTGASSMDFKGTIAQREVVLEFIGWYLYPAKSDCSKDVRDKITRCKEFADGL
jgi:hypothetical protein